jgi:heme/copper-type cytochrome/quinol oxidase subunit 3
MLLLTLRFRPASLNLALRPFALCAALGTSTTSDFNASGATRAEKEAYLRSLPATTPLLERVRLWWELLNQPYGNRPALTRVLLVNAEDEKQRVRLPLQSLTHPFFIAPLSEVPLLLGLSLFGVLSGTVNYLHQGFMGLAAEPFLLLFLMATLRWCGYMEQLGANPAIYSGAVRRNLLAGILLFIVSEVMIFFALFWALFHSALNPSPELGSVWPPLHLLMLECSHWPTLNTALLVYSGGAANVGLYALQNLDQRLLLTGSLPAVAERLGELTPPRRMEVLLFGSRMEPQEGRLGQLRLQLHRVYGGFLYAVVCGALFLLCQLYEYGSASYAMSDGVYGSVFYGLTGLHGLHVLVGLLLLLLVIYRLGRGFFDQDQNTQDGPTGGVWYWHFVDVVWLALFLVLYVWGNSRGEPQPLAEEAGVLVAVTLVPRRRRCRARQAFQNFPTHFNQTL